MPNSALDNLFVSLPSLSQGGGASAQPPDAGSNFDDALQLAGQSPFDASAETGGTIDISGPTWSDLNSWLPNRAPPAPHSGHDRPVDTDAQQSSSNDQSANDRSWQSRPKDNSQNTVADRAGPEPRQNRTLRKTNENRDHTNDDSQKNSSPDATVNRTAGPKPEAPRPTTDNQSASSDKDSPHKPNGESDTAPDVTVDAQEQVIAVIASQLSGARSSANASVALQTSSSGNSAIPNTETDANTAAADDAKLSATPPSTDQAAKTAATAIVNADSESILFATQNQAAVNQDLVVPPLNDQPAGAADKTTGPAQPDLDKQVDAQVQTASSSAQATPSVNAMSVKLVDGLIGKDKRQHQSLDDATDHDQLSPTTIIDPAAAIAQAVSAVVVGVPATITDKRSETTSGANQSVQPTAQSNQPASLAGHVPSDVANAAASNAPGALTASGTEDKFAVPAQRTTTPQVDQVRFVQRVANAFKSVDQQGGEIRLRLSPPELGSLKVEVSVRNGTLTARLEAENNTTRSLLLDNLPALRERLAGQNMKIERFDVDLKHDGAGNGSANAPPDFSGARQNSNRPQNNVRPTVTPHHDTNVLSSGNGLSSGSDSGQIDIVV